jgi:hypothetical protein
MTEGSGFITPTNGSGSGFRRPKNTWIRWIRIRIRNTGLQTRRLENVDKIMYLVPGYGNYVLHRIYLGNNYQY